MSTLEQHVAEVRRDQLEEQGGYQKLPFPERDGQNKAGEDREVAEEMNPAINGV